MISTQMSALTLWVKQHTIVGSLKMKLSNSGPAGKHLRTYSGFSVFDHTSSGLASLPANLTPPFTGLHGIKI